MIKKEKIEEASESYAESVWGKNIFGTMQFSECTGDFESGAQWAIEELKPMFIEFADWIGKESLTFEYYSVNDDYFWTASQDEALTTEELFELFLKGKEDENKD